MSIRQIMVAITFAVITCAPHVASSRPQESSASAENKALAERALNTNKGAVAIVFNEDGEPVAAVTREGRTIPECQVCTPELERKYGPKCEKARRASEALRASVEPREDRTLVCDKLLNTNVQAVRPINVIRHTGSQCATYVFYVGTLPKTYQYCW